MKRSSTRPKILVVGSCSVDIVLRIAHLPEENETILSNHIETFFGGKGANQSIGVSRLGVSTYLVGCVGMDPHGQQVLRNLVEEKVNVGHVYEDLETETGTAYVWSSQGKNSIVVSPAANYKIKPQNIDDAEKLFSTADLVLVQMEIPMEAIVRTFELAKKYKTKLGIYAAPAMPISKEILDDASFIVVKSKDLGIIFKEENKEQVLSKYPNKLMVRESDYSTTFHDGEKIVNLSQELPNEVFGMGMGDAFTSGFSVAYCHGNSIKDCVEFGNKVASKVSEKRGSQEGLPYLKDLE